jgi:sporulation protein YtfJ
MNHKGGSPMDITDVVKAVMEQIKETVRSETVIGTPVHAEESVIIPVSKVSFGFGAGGGTGEMDKHSGMGAGGGASVEPVAFVVVSKGKAQLLPLKSREATLTRLIDIVPSLLDIVKGMKTSEKEKEKTKEKDTNK